MYLQAKTATKITSLVVAEDLLEQEEDCINLYDIGWE